MRARIISTTAAAALALAALPGAAVAAEASVSVDVAGAYVFRGATFNDGLVVQPGLEVSGLPIDIGVWANLDIDDYDGAVADGEFSEIDVYGSYSLPIEGVDISLGYTEYTYPGGGAEADREVSVSTGLDVILDPSLAVFYGFEGGIEESWYAEAAVGHAFDLTDALRLELGATVGYMNPNTGESGFSHFTASATAGYGIVSAGVTYVGQIDDDVLPDVEDGGVYDTEVYAVLAIAHDL